MSLVALRELHPLFAAEVVGLDLRRVDDESTFDEIRAALDRYAVLAFRDQRLSDEQQATFTQRLGGSAFPDVRLERPVGATAPSPFMALERIGNLSETNEIVTPDDRRRIAKLGNRIWHTDGSHTQPCVRYTALYGCVVPPVRADTEFADTRAAYEALDSETKSQIEGLRAFHSLVYSRYLLGFSFSEEEAAKLPGAEQPLVRTIPGSGRRALYMGAHASHVVDMLLPEGRLLLRDLTEHATQERFVYRHDWRTDDMLIWDNRTTLHRARPFDDRTYRRDMRRTRTLDIEPVPADTTRH